MWRHLALRISFIISLKVTWNRRRLKLMRFTHKSLFFQRRTQQAVTTDLWCNFLVFSLKFGVWWATSSHVMLAEEVHSFADMANQVLLAYGLSSSKRGPDALHPYGYSKERFVWSLISAVGIFLGSGATIVHGIENLWVAHPPDNIKFAAIVIGRSFVLEVMKRAAAEGMIIGDYVWRVRDPTSVAVMAKVIRIKCWGMRNSLMAKLRLRMLS